MAFKVVLVHLDNSKSSPARLNAAVKPAHAWGARLTGADPAGLNSEIQQKTGRRQGLSWRIASAGTGQ